MTPLKFYKFINDNPIEWHWNHYDFNWHLLVFIPAYLLVDFCNMFQYSDFDDGGLLLTGWLSLLLVLLLEPPPQEIKKAAKKSIYI